MPVDKKLIHFNSKDNFMSANGVNGNVETPNTGTSEEDRNAEYGNLKGTSIVFIKDSKEIWTHGNLYKSVNWSVLGESEVITFTIGFNVELVEFQAEKNMTFGQWISSKYCTVNYVVNGSRITFTYNGSNYSLEGVNTSTTIVAGNQYYASLERE